MLPVRNHAPRAGSNTSAESFTKLESLAKSLPPAANTLPSASKVADSGSNPFRIGIWMNITDTAAIHKLLSRWDETTTRWGGQVAPVENTDYDANTQQCGGGADISSEPIRRRSRR
jgi:hypothetical protein